MTIWEVTLDKEKYRGQIELEETPDYHEFRMCVQTCDPAIVDKIQTWMKGISRMTPDEVQLMKAIDGFFGALADVRMFEIRPHWRQDSVHIIDDIRALRARMEVSE